jgi:FtsH-binding integral membrane protein
MSIGAHAFMMYGFGGGLLAWIALMGLIVMIKSNNDMVENQRMGLLLAFGFFKGNAIGPMIAMAFDLDPSVVTTAFLITAAVFCTFSLLAMSQSRRDVLYVGATLGSLMGVLCILSIINMFVHNPALSLLQLCFGLVTVSFYIVYDTQVIIAAAFAGNYDVVRHALELFVNFVGLFVRILQFILQIRERTRQATQHKQVQTRHYQQAYASRW